MAAVTDARISTTWPSHPKTKKLRRRLGPGGPLGFICLLAYAAANRTDGDLSGMSDEDIELAADWDGAPGEFVSAAAEAGFLDGEAGSYRLHDWADHQPWANGAEERSQKGRFAVLCRDYGRQRAMEMMPGYAAKLRGETEKTSASNQADDLVDDPNDRVRSSPTPIPTPTPRAKTPCSPPGGGRARRKRKVTLREYLDECEANGTEPIPTGDAVHGYPDSMGLPAEWIPLAWWAFQGRYLAEKGEDEKRYTSWPQVFRNAVRGNWLKLWWVQPNGAPQLTTAGMQAKREMESQQREARA